MLKYRLRDYHIIKLRRLWSEKSYVECFLGELIGTLN